MRDWQMPFWAYDLFEIHPLIKLEVQFVGHFDFSLYSLLFTQRDQGESPLKLPLAKTEVMEYASMCESWTLASHC